MGIFYFFKTIIVSAVGSGYYPPEPPVLSLAISLLVENVNEHFSQPNQCFTFPFFHFFGLVLFFSILRKTPHFTAMALFPTLAFLEKPKIDNFAIILKKIITKITQGRECKGRLA
jgi:hypothetical protein